MRVNATVALEAVAPNPQPLLSFLRAYRDAVQYIVNEIWRLEKIPSVKDLHRMYYKTLRSWGFRSHHASEIYKRAKEIVKSVKKNNGSKPVLKRLTARLHPYDYRLDIRSRTLKVAVLNGEWVELRLLGIGRLERFLSDDWRVKEVLVSYRGGGVKVYVTLEKEVERRNPRSIMGIDINLDNVSYVVIDIKTGYVITAGVIMFNGFKRALHMRMLAEGLQRRLGRHWRFMRWSLETYRRWLRRARNIVADTAHRVAKKLVEIADKFDSLIVLENLKGLRTAASERSDRLAWLFTQFAYRRLQSFIEYKAAWRGLETIYVSPRGTSRRSPIGGKLRRLNYRWVLLPNGIATTRDIVAAWNLALKALTQMRGSTGSRGALIAGAVRR